jgi:Tfp pilus assembly protein PilV
MMMKRMLQTTSECGQSLVEMIVVIGMVVLLTTGIIAGTTASLSRTETSRVRSVALSHAQAGIELTRAMRDNGWAAFAAKGSRPTTYCVGDFTTVAPCPVNIDSKFTRSVTLELTTIGSPPTSTMKVTSQVVWDPSNAVQLTTYLTQWK